MSRLASLTAWARRLRPLAAARSLSRPAELARSRRQYRELGLRRSPLASIRHEQVSGSSVEPPWLDLNPSLEEIRSAAGFKRLPSQAQEGALGWPDRGYLVLERFLSDDLVDRINSEVDQLLGAGDLRFHARSPRVMNSVRKSAAVAEAVSDPRLVATLGFLMGRSPELFQTISFLVGSQQRAHSDAFHMMTEPPGFLIGVWAALEDIDEDQGPVFYLPGSHKLPYVMSEDLDIDRPGRLTVADKGPAYTAKMGERVAEADADPVKFTARKGDVLLWHHNLLHGGLPITREGATRKSLVAHFFAADVLCYHEVTERLALMPR